MRGRKAMHKDTSVTQWQRAPAITTKEREEAKSKAAARGLLDTFAIMKKAGVQDILPFKVVFHDFRWIYVADAYTNDREIPNEEIKCRLRWAALEHYETPHMQQPEDGEFNICLPIRCGWKRRDFDDKQLIKVPASELDKIISSESIRPSFCAPDR